MREASQLRCFSVCVQLQKRELWGRVPVLSTLLLHCEVFTRSRSWPFAFPYKFEKYITVFQSPPPLGTGVQSEVHAAICSVVLRATERSLFMQLSKPLILSFEIGGSKYEWSICKAEVVNSKTSAHRNQCHIYIHGAVWFSSSNQILKVEHVCAFGFNTSLSHSRSAMFPSFKLLSVIMIIVRYWIPPNVFGCKGDIDYSERTSPQSRFLESTALPAIIENSK